MHSIAHAVGGYVATLIPEDVWDRADSTEEAFEVAVTIWNAVVRDARGVTDTHVAKVRQDFIKRGWPALDIVDQFIACKREDFGSDLRLVDHFAVQIDENGKVIFHVCELGPDGPIHEHPDDEL